MPTAKSYVRVRGAVWKHPSKKKGYSRSVGGYDLHRGDRNFFLTPLNGGKRKMYASPQAAKADGWVKE